MSILHVVGLQEPPKNTSCLQVELECGMRVRAGLVMMLWLQYYHNIMCVMTTVLTLPKDSQCVCLGELVMQCDAASTKFSPRNWKLVGIATFLFLMFLQGLE